MNAKVCNECGRGAGRLRRERCDACYMRLYRGGEVHTGAVCSGCTERRRELLCHELVGGKDEVVCGNCALLLRRTRPVITTVRELQRRASRERRVTRAVELAAGRRAAVKRPVREVRSFDVPLD
jgi:hypothetical protein